jgi:hypothetical protein
MSSILDDLFHWASQQPAGDQAQIDFAIATNEKGARGNVLGPKGGNIISFAEGTLDYHAREDFSGSGRYGGLFISPAYFESEEVQRHYAGSELTQPLVITISSPTFTLRGG